MSWRTVILADRAKIDYSMGYMVVRGKEVHRVFMDEIETVLLESTAVSLTAAWVNECMHRKIKIIFCDEKRNPCGEVLAYCGSYDTSRCIRSQIHWDKNWTQQVWTLIVSEKIHQQEMVLKEFGKNEAADLLAAYQSQMQLGDATNREGHAAKVYFNALFGLGFSRRNENAENSALNYGYAIILSAFNREIAASGYLTQLGVFHDNIFNPFNLGCDFMEPFRPLVDRMVLHMEIGTFGPEEKRHIVNLLNDTVKISGKQTTVTQAVKLYSRSVLQAIEEKNLDCIRFYEYGV